MAWVRREVYLGRCQHRACRAAELGAGRSGMPVKQTSRGWGAEAVAQADVESLRAVIFLGETHSHVPSSIQFRIQTILFGKE